MWLQEALSTLGLCRLSLDEEVMGREIRRVPPDWKHPRDDSGHYKPLLDTDYETAAAEWLEALFLWEEGEHPDQLNGSLSGVVAKYAHYWEWGGNPPNPNDRHPKWNAEEATAWVVYENVSEGTPITPVFGTRDELVNYLVDIGNEWDGPCSRKAAEAFVSGGYAPSMIITRDKGLVRGVHAAAEFVKDSDG